MPPHRNNTLVVDFSVLPKRPVLDQVEEFLKKVIKLDMADVKNIQLHNLKNCVFIEMNNAGVAPRMQKQHHLQHAFTHQEVTYRIPVYVDGPSTTVRITDLPPQMCNTVITDHLQQYGKVISIENEVWKHYFTGIPNGVRIVRMKMEKPVPARIVVDNHSTYVNYPNNNVPSAAKQKQSQTTSITAEQTKTDKCGKTDPPSAHTDTSDDDDDDDDDDSSNSEDNEQGNQIEATTELESAKRRLSTESNNATNEENEAKRSCNQGGQKPESEWKVHNTRARKKCNK